MAKTIALPNELYDRLASLARPFVDKEPVDVIRWLVEKESGAVRRPTAAQSPSAVSVEERAPRERGAVVDMDGDIIRADSVPDLCKKVMQVLSSKGHWDKVLELAPYKTSSQRYLFSKTPKHPNGKNFFVPIKCRDVYVEAHKNYKTSLDQLKKLVAKCGMTLTYKGT